MPIEPCRTLLARCLQAEDHVLSMYLQAHLSSWFLPICLSPLAGHNILLLNIAGGGAESLADLQVEEHHCSPLSSNPALPSEKAKRLAGHNVLWVNAATCLSDTQKGDPSGHTQGPSLLNLWAFLKGACNVWVLPVIRKFPSLHDLPMMIESALTVTLVCSLLGMPPLLPHGLERTEFAPVTPELIHVHCWLFSSRVLPQGAKVWETLLGETKAKKI